MGLIETVRASLGKGSPIVGAERGADWYDEDYSTNAHYRVPYYESRYYPVWSVIVDRIRRSVHQHVLEVGCGSGQLAVYIIEQGGVESYTGVDFSHQAVELAKQIAPEGTFRIADATDPRTYDLPVDCIVCTEVLEHIDDDVAVVSRFPSGARCLCTVPDFPYPSHVRHFPSADAVGERYRAHFTEFEVTTFKATGHKDNPLLRYFLIDGLRA